MKKALLLLALLATIYSCTKETDDMVTKLEYTGKWELVKMTGSFIGSETTGSDMEWQETYIINEDETFVKTRVRGDSTTFASGTYELKDVEESGNMGPAIKDIELFYDIENNIIGNCYSNKTIEYLFFSSDHRLINTWNACDGPGLEYVKSK
ncbi:MAG: hypothetical protein JJE07_03390 [Flavobacteriaceae bacterium]|nr:hypothetical protein [Flavobacteriaceae bacterium]